MSRVGYLYVATSPSGKRYVGITVTPKGVKERWRQHIGKAQRGGVSALCTAIRKYGGDRFEVRSVLVSNWEHLLWLEPRAIAALGTLAPTGYNLHTGGRQSLHHPETIERIRHAALNRSPELRARVRAQRLGKKHTEETKMKVSLANRGRKHPKRAKRVKE